jgi:hypothetical protein
MAKVVLNVVEAPTGKNEAANKDGVRWFDGDSVALRI